MNDENGIGGACGASGAWLGTKKNATRLGRTLGIHLENRQTKLVLS